MDGILGHLNFSRVYSNRISVSGTGISTYSVCNDSVYYNNTLIAASTGVNVRDNCANNTFYWNNFSSAIGTFICESFDGASCGSPLPQIMSGTARHTG